MVYMGQTKRDNIKNIVVCPFFCLSTVSLISNTECCISAKLCLGPDNVEAAEHPGNPRERGVADGGGGGQQEVLHRVRQSVARLEATQDSKGWGPSEGPCCL